MNLLVRIIKSKSFIIGISAILVYTLSGFFLVPYLVRHYLPKIVDEKINKKADIGDVHFNPYILALEVNDFGLNEPEGAFILGFRRLFMDFELKSIFKWAWTFDRLDILEPRVNVEISPDGNLNLAQLVPIQEEVPDKGLQEVSQSDQEDAFPGLIIYQIAIEHGQIDVVDERQSIPAVVNFKPLNLQIENLTTLPEQEGLKNITVTSKDGEVFKWSGTISLNPVATAGTVVLENIRMATLWQFVRDTVNLEMPNGSLNLSSQYNIDLSMAEPQLILDHLELVLTGFDMRLLGEKEPFFRLPSTRIVDTKFDFLKQTIDVGRIVLDGGNIRLVANQKGIFNFERIVADGSGKPASEKKTTGEPGNDGSKPWSMNVEGFEMDGFAVDYHDQSRENDIKGGIENIRVGFKVEAQAGAALAKLSVNNIVAGLAGITAGLTDAPEPALKVGQFKLEDGIYNLKDHRLVLEKIYINGGNVDFRREKDGTINLADLFKPPERENIIEEPENVPDEFPPFRYLIGSVDVSGFGFAFSDLSVKPDGKLMNLEDIAVVLNHIDGHSPITFDAALKVKQGGQLISAGTINPSVPSAKADIRLDNLELSTFQPYLDQAVSLVLDSGEFSSKGTLQYGMEQAGSQIAFEGGFGLDNIRLIQPGGTETYLGWKNLRSDQLKLQLEPNRLEIGPLNLVELVGKLIIYEDRTLNFAKVIKTDPEDKESPSKISETEEQDLFPVMIRRINLTDGKIQFADLSLIPQFGTKIHELKGTILGISTVGNDRARIHLDGHVDDYGTAKVEGELITADPKVYTDISLNFRNVEMTRLTPYSGRFAGRRIDSGKLSVDLKYLIENGRLAGENQIIVEQLILGETVKSPDAVNLPLDLAVALLEDSRGVIDIGLPVKGNLDAPEFSFGGLIWKAFVNLITRIATSPFRALAALIPGGADENFNIITFEAGRSQIMPPEREKLDKLAEALKMRPRLKLTVEGRYNPETDGAALRSASLRRTLAIRQDHQIEPGEDPGPMDYNNPEILEILEEIFEERLGADALTEIKEKLEAKKEQAKKNTGRTAEGDSESARLLAGMLFDRLIHTEPVGDKEFIKLAMDRSHAIANRLSETDGISEERIGIKPPSAPDKKTRPTALLNLEPIR